MSIATTTFNGAHWRIDVAGAEGGYVADEQDARARVAAINAALETEISIRVGEAFFNERNKFLDVVAQLQIANRELEAEIAATIATTEHIAAERDAMRSLLADLDAVLYVLCRGGKVGQDEAAEWVLKVRKLTIGGR
jgi:hypothetical protein